MQLIITALPTTHSPGNAGIRVNAVAPGACAADLLFRLAFGTLQIGLTNGCPSTSFSGSDAELGYIATMKNTVDRKLSCASSLPAYVKTNVLPLSKQACNLLPPALGLEQVQSGRL